MSTSKILGLITILFGLEAFGFNLKIEFPGSDSVILHMVLGSFMIVGGIFMVIMGDKD